MPLHIIHPKINRTKAVNAIFQAMTQRCTVYTRCHIFADPFLGLARPLFYDLGLDCFDAGVKNFVLTMLPKGWLPRF
jgi:hypothetical protein